MLQPKMLSKPTGLGNVRKKFTKLLNVRASPGTQITVNFS